MSEFDPFAPTLADPLQDPVEPVDPQVQAQRDKEAAVEGDRLAAETEAQRVRQEREDREAEELSQDDRVKVALNQRVTPRGEAVFLAATGHNDTDEN